MKHTIGGKMEQGVPFCQNGPIPYLSIFAISQEYDYICLHFEIEYMYCHSLKIPTKYHDNRLDIFNVGSIFLSYAILPRLPLHSSLYMVLLYLYYQVFPDSSDMPLTQSQWSTTNHKLHVYA